MQKLISTIVVMVITLALVSCNQPCCPNNKEKKATENDSSATKQAADTSTSNKLDFLKELNGKYPHKVKLFENQVFTQRLEKLLGSDRYNFLKKTWAVEVPMEFKENMFVANACQAHNCHATNFIIVYDFSKNVLHAGIREENQVKTYAEDGSSSPTVGKWGN